MLKRSEDFGDAWVAALDNVKTRLADSSPMQ